MLYDKFNNFRLRRMKNKGFDGQNKKTQIRQNSEQVSYYIKYNNIRQIKRFKTKLHYYITTSSNMTIIYNILLIVSLVTLSQPKRINKLITMAELQNKQIIFLTRFDFGIGEGNITIKHRKKGVDNSQFSNIKIGLLLDQNYGKFKYEENCVEKEKLFHQTHKIRFFDAVQGTQIVKVNQAVHQNLWFVYIYSCQQITFSTQDGSEGINFDVVLINNGSHLGEDQSLLWPFVIQFILWIAIIAKYLFKPFTKALVQNNIETVHMILYTGYLLIGLGLFYKLINLITVYSSGESIVVFDILHSAIKALSQGVIIGLIIAVGWGWKLSHIQYKVQQIICPVVVTILNIFCIINWNLAQDIEQSYHQYQQASGILVFVIRVLIGIIFLVGCLKLNAQSVGKRKYFISKFTKYGLIHLFGWPVAVVLGQILLPKYLLNEVIVLTEEYVHLIMNAYICWLFIYPDSEYQKVNIKQGNDGILPDYKYRK